MRTKRAIYVTIVICLSFFTLLYLFHFGPFGIVAGDERILSSCNLTNGDSLFIVAHRTQSWAEPYNVRLYRVSQETNYSVCFLSHEDSYWWGCSLKSQNFNQIVEINVFGAKLASYKISNQEVVWNNQKRPISPSYAMDGVKVSIEIPKAISRRNVLPRSNYSK